jgi:hypothetical protein
MITIDTTEDQDQDLAAEAEETIEKDTVPDPQETVDTTEMQADREVPEEDKKIIE